MSFTSSSLSVKRKSRLGCLVAVMAILGIAVIAGIFYLGFLSQKVEGQFKQGLIHYNKGAVLLKKGVSRTVDLKLIANEKMRFAAGRLILKSMDQARREFAAAKNNFSRMRQSSMFNWEKETADLMTQSADEAQKSAPEISTIIGASPKITNVLNDVSDGAVKFQQAVNQSNSLISLCNSGHYAEVKSAAPPLAQMFADAKVRIGSADKLDPKARLSSFLDQITKGEQLANNLAMMADAGQNGRLDDFNRLSQESNTLIGQVIKVSQSKLVTDPGSWINDQLEVSIGQAWRHESKADKLKKKALDLWSKNT